MPDPNRLVCPSCHQLIAEQRNGARLPPLKAAIFDAINASGDLGISSRELVSSEIYRDRRKPDVSSIKSHIGQINDLLGETDWRIRSDRMRWFLVRAPAARFPEAAE